MNRSHINPELSTKRSSNVHFVQHLSQHNCNRQAFKEIQRSEIEKVLPKPKNKFVIARSVISKVIKKESKLTKLEDISKVASIIWKKKRNSTFDKYFSYLAKKDEEFNNRSYKDLAKRNTKIIQSSHTTLLWSNNYNNTSSKICKSKQTKQFKFKNFRNHTSNGVSKFESNCSRDSQKKESFTYSKKSIDPFTNLEIEDVFILE
ncbi:unnamed protein product [Ambrosiozyma monospora]|uniref:Unnamed protein product n=1 Tax=Ambrosiozyma monospora TaxID=43982 RepID=A0A9W7DJE7_AMBMO|nr:unnamed protein product [Ambrosiozyma monospora]